MFGALNMTAVLGPFMMRHPDVRGGMEQFMVQHVLPVFTASEPYLRSIVRLSLSLFFFWLGQKFI